MRFAIFSSWGIALAAAVAGSVMNTRSFHVVRFGAPVLGSILMLWLGTFHPGELLAALPSIAISVAILASLWLAFRGQTWSSWAVDFRRQVVGRVPWALPRSLLASLAMVLVDAAASLVPAIDVVVAFLVAYPVTLFPFSGVGILDAVVIATLLQVGTNVGQEGLVAGVVVWRVVTIGGPILLGLGSLALWKWQMLRHPVTPAG